MAAVLDPPPTHTAAALRALGIYQRLLLALVVVQLLIVAGLVAVLNHGPFSEPFGPLLVTLWVVGLLGGLVAFQTGHTLFGWYGGLTLGGLTVLGACCPVLGGGLPGILATNVLTNRVFRRHGVRVGLLGASRADIQALGEVRTAALPGPVPPGP